MSEPGGRGPLTLEMLYRQKPRNTPDADHGQPPHRALFRATGPALARCRACGTAKRCGCAGDGALFFRNIIAVDHQRDRATAAPGHLFDLFLLRVAARAVEVEIQRAQHQFFAGLEQQVVFGVAADVDVVVFLGVLVGGSGAALGAIGRTTSDSAALGWPIPERYYPGPEVSQ